MTVEAIVVCESLSEEHRTTELMLDRLEQFLLQLEQEEKKPEGLDSLLQDLCLDMNTHFACEEKGLFPIVNPYHPMVLMEVEHEEIIALRNHFVDLVSGEMGNEQIGKLLEQGRAFIEELRNHIAREDAGIFPVCEQSLSEFEKQRVLDVMSEVRTLAKSQPIPDVQRPERYYRTFEIACTDSDFQKPLAVQLLGEEARLQVKLISIRSGEELKTHWSPRQVVMFCLSGEADFTANNEMVVLKAGKGLILTPQLRHGVKAKTDCQLLTLFQEL